MYENAARGRAKRRKGHSRGVTTYDAERGAVYFTEWRLRRTILSPAKWPGSIFEIPFLSPLLVCPCLSFSSLLLVQPLRRPFSANGINFSTEKYGAMTRELSFAFFFLPRRPFSRSFELESLITGNGIVITSHLSKDNYPLNHCYLEEKG